MIHLRVEVFVIPEKPSEGEDYYVIIYLFKLPPIFAPNTTDHPICVMTNQNTQNTICLVKQDRS